MPPVTPILAFPRRRGRDFGPLHRGIGAAAFGGNAIGMNIDRAFVLLSSHSRPISGSRYAFAAVSWNSAVSSPLEKSLVMRLKAFQRTVYEYEALSTGKLLSNMHRLTPNCSMQKS